MPKRRTNGEGSIYKASDGRWRAALVIGQERNAEGKLVSKRKVFSAATKAEAGALLTKGLREQQTGMLIADERTTVEQYLAQWVKAVAPSLRPSTLRSYEDTIRLHIQEPISKRPLAKLSAMEVQTFLNKKFASGLSARSVGYIRAVLRAALNDALRYGLVYKNVAALAEPPKAERHEIEPFTLEQAKRFLKRIEGHRLEALFTICLAVGLRKGEALGLKWVDLDLIRHKLTVGRALQRQKGKGLVEIPPKSDRGRRVIDLPAFAVRSLLKHKASQETESIEAGSAWSDTGFVFTSTIGTPLDPRNAHDVFRKILEPIPEETAAGIPPLPEIRFHDLRHSAATLLLAQGVPARVVMDLLGHSQISLTLGTYSHVMESMTQDAADKMDAALGGPAGLSQIANPEPVATDAATETGKRRVN